MCLYSSHFGRLVQQIYVFFVIFAEAVCFMNHLFLNTLLMLFFACFFVFCLVLTTKQLGWLRRYVLFFLIWGGSIILTSVFSDSEDPVSKVVYLCETHLCYDATVLNGRAVLYFNSDESLFVHEDAPKYTSPKLTTLSTGPSGITIGALRGDPEGFPVYINRKEGYLCDKDYYRWIGTGPEDGVVFTEELPSIAWEITDQTKEMEGLFCVKAFGEFGGRVYDVWFTPDIPVSLGPFKLWGLPGLILQAKSRDGKVAYEFVSYESNVKDHPPIEKPHGHYMTWEEWEEHVIKRLLKVEAQSGGSQRVSCRNPSGRANPYAPEP